MQRAIEEGTDFIETDILASKDGHLICFHDVTLDATTDVANRTEFANRKRTYEVQGENMSGWFVGMWVAILFVVILKKKSYESMVTCEVMFHSSGLYS